MVVRRRRKTRKLRGRTRTMGWGSIGQHRKAGSRGGKGAVGYHKHKWMWVIKYFPEWYGKRGFIPRNPSYEEDIREISLKDLADIIEKLKLSNQLEYSGNRIRIDLVKLGYNKLTGSGKITVPVEVVTKYATEKAIEKIKSIGGEVIFLKSLDKE
ncbi:MAG: uL15 family ribosomal protein [Sulfolobales archaeon]